MKKLFLFLCAMSLVFGIVYTASAVPVQFTYTADNFVNAWYKDGGSPVSLALGTNKGNWRIADTATLDLATGTEYEIIWQAENSGALASGNPGGFLAEISSSRPLTVDSLFSSSAWEVALQVGDLSVPTDFNSLSWKNATEWASNDGTVGNPIWFNVNNGPILGIDGDAQWIWWEKNFGLDGAPGGDDSVFIRVSVTPVPEPATMLLLGAGLIGLAGLGRKKFVKKT